LIDAQSLSHPTRITTKHAKATDSKECHLDARVSENLLNIFTNTWCCHAFWIRPSNVTTHRTVQLPQYSYTLWLPVLPLSLFVSSANYCGVNPG